MTYQDRIAQIVPDANSRHVEAWMRSEFGTLDSLSPGLFRLRALQAAQVAREHASLSESLAQSYGI